MRRWFAAAMTVSALLPLGSGARAQAADTRSVTVVAVVDGGGFTPYHYDFLGHQHPWNLDADTANDLDFYGDPSGYISGYPGATPVNVTIPTLPGQRVDTLRSTTDAAEWSKIERSTSADTAKIYRFPGTKIVGAVNFAEEFYGDNSAHGTRSAASAAGNIHGTCPECVFVFVQGSVPEGLRWAASQPWIDVITNSYGHSTLPTGGATRDNIYFGSPVETTKAFSDDGGVVTFSSGNGFLNAYDVPMFTYWSSEKGPDWMITVGAVSAFGQQTYLGAGKPVDISSIGDSYPSTGGRSANGIGTHSGTSNASPTTGGYFAKLIQASREALGDTSEGHAAGVVASGAAFACGPANAACVLGDGELTRRELVDVVFSNVLPSPSGTGVQTIPTTEYAYYYQGHGVFGGKFKANVNVPAPYESEWRRLVDAAKGAVSSFERPAGETTWFVVDSKCRQRLWGAWHGGLYTGANDPTFDVTVDAPAIAFYAWCSPLPPGVLAGGVQPPST